MGIETILLAAGIGSSLIGAGVSYMGAQQQGAAARQAADYQAAVARNNAILAERQAQDSLQRGQIAEAQKRQETALLAGRQKAVMAGNGVDLTFGSAVDILGDTAALGEQDALTVRSNAEREALGYRQQAGNYRSDAQMSEMKGASAQSAAQTQGFTSLIGGATGVADQWFRYKNYTPRGTA